MDMFMTKNTPSSNFLITLNRWLYLFWSGDGKTVNQKKATV